VLYLYANTTACPVDEFNCPVTEHEFVGQKTQRHETNGNEKYFCLIGKARAEHYVELCLREWVKVMFGELRNIFSFHLEKSMSGQWARTTVCPWLGKQ